MGVIGDVTAVTNAVAAVFCCWCLGYVIAATIAVAAVSCFWCYLTVLIFDRLVFIPNKLVIFSLVEIFFISLSVRIIYVRSWHYLHHESRNNIIGFEQNTRISTILQFNIATD